MTEQQRQEPRIRSVPKNVVAARTSSNISPEVSQRIAQDVGQQTQHEAQLRDLQQYICELLIKNQRLRWLLESARNHQCEELADDYDQNVA